jgi:ribosomal protein S19
LKFDPRIYRPSFFTPPPTHLAPRAKGAKCHTYLRYARIPNLIVGQRVAVHNGRFFNSFIIRSWMCGHRFGEFVLTKKLGAQIHVKKTKKGKKNKKK